MGKENLNCINDKGLLEGILLRYQGQTLNVNSINEITGAIKSRYEPGSVQFLENKLARNERKAIAKSVLMMMNTVYNVYETKQNPTDELILGLLENIANYYGVNVVFDDKNKTYILE